MKGKTVQEEKEKAFIITSEAVKCYLNGIEDPNDCNYGILQGFFSTLRKKPIFLLLWEAELDEAFTGARIYKIIETYEFPALGTCSFRFPIAHTVPGTPVSERDEKTGKDAGVVLCHHVQTGHGSRSPGISYWK